MNEELHSENEELHSAEDVKTAIEIFHRAIDFFKIPDEPTPEAAKDFAREDGSIDLSRIPLVTVRRWENGPTFLNMIFIFDGILTVSADYNPLVSILDFLQEARRILGARFPHWSEDEREKHSEIEAFKMTILLFSRMYPRWDLTMGNFISEVIHAWYIDWKKDEAQVYSEAGVRPTLVKETQMFRGLLKGYENDLVKLWLNAPDKKLEERKMQFAQEYPSILSHWQTLRDLSRDERVDWREYAKPGKFADTPDDLISVLEDSEAAKTSHLALEHTARRVGLFKVTQDAKVLEKRARQVKVSGYTPRQLATFLSEGEKLLGEMQSKADFTRNGGTGETDEQT